MDVKMDNAAFKDDPSELARILLDVAARVDGQQGPVNGLLHDSNGNLVGSWAIKAQMSGSEPHCADCGEWGVPTGHMECQYPKDHD